MRKTGRKSKRLVPVLFGVFKTLANALHYSEKSFRIDKHHDIRAKISEP